MSDSLLRGTAFAGKQVQYQRTYATFEQTYVELKSLGCSDPLIIAIMATMAVEQPWIEGGRLKGFKGFNNNFGGVDLTAGNWAFNPTIHNGYTVALEGGTDEHHAYASFKSLKAFLSFKLGSFRAKGFDAVRDSQSYALLYYTKWNGLGYRTRKEFKSIRQTTTGAAELRKYPSTIWAAADRQGISAAESQYRRIETIVNQIKSGTLPPASSEPNYEIEFSSRGGSLSGDIVQPPEPFRYALLPPGQTAPTASITPFLGSLESFHPFIQYELTRRRVSSETANTYMPFVKLTSLVTVEENNLLDGVTSAWCPTLGPHGEDSIEFDDIYLPQNNRSVIGYAITTTDIQGIYARTPVVVDLDAAVSVNQTNVRSQATDQVRIPMPGIVEVNAERSTSGPMGIRGGLMKADIKIAAYSVGQLDALLTYYLRPSTRVVLEWGRKSSNPVEAINPFPWQDKNPTELANDFSALITNPVAQTELIKRHVYDSYGNYEIFIGYVVKFDVKYNKNNVYDITLTVHSVQQFELPTVHTGVKSNCANAVDKCKAMDIREYFDDSYAWKQNSFRQLLSTEAVLAESADTPRASVSTTGFGDDLVAIKNPSTENGGAGSREAGTDENEFFVSWQFFVNKILNDKNKGVLSIFPDDPTPSSPNETTPALSTQELLKLGLIRPVKTVTDEELNASRTQLIANEVGWHPDLRSTDPNVMVIWNEAAQGRRAEEDGDEQFLILQNAALANVDSEQFSRNNHVEEWMRKSTVGSFKNIQKTATQAATGLLTQGVWLNTKAIRQAFSSTDTVTAAINSLLSMMNSATQGYWNLQLYSTDRLHSGLFVIDMGLSKRLESKTTNTSEQNRILSIDPEEALMDGNTINNNVLTSINDINLSRYQQSTKDLKGLDTPKYIYMFNRGTKRFGDGELGSDLIDLTVDFNLPQVIAVQAIAGVGGPAQKSTLNAINIDQLKRISLIKNVFPTCDDDICKESDCNSQQRNISALEARFKEAETELARLPQPPSLTEGTDVPVVFDVELENRRLQLQNKVDAARSEFRAAQVQQSYGNTMVISAFRELSSLGTILRYVEFNPSAMMRKLNLDSTNAEDRRPTPIAHAFNSSNLTKTTVSVTLPGIGGIELFQSFLVDRVPSILKRGYYVVTKIIHKFSSSGGWVTTIEGRFRYNPLQVQIDKPYDKKCVGAPPASRPATTGTGTPSAGSGTNRVQPSQQTDIVRRASILAQRRNNYVSRIRSMTPEQLRQEFDLLEKSVERPRFANIAKAEEWERRLKSGQVDIQRENFEMVKTEIRKRNSLGIQARRGIPEAFKSISSRRLNPKQWPSGFRGVGSSGTF